MELFIFAASLWLYLAAAAGYVIHLLSAREMPRRAASIGLLLAVACDTVALLVRGAAVSTMGLSFYDQLSLLAWAISGLYLLVQFRYRLPILGALVSTVAFLLTLAAYMVYSGVAELPGNLKHAWLPVHVAPTFVGYALFAVAACVSVIYLVQEAQLKARRRSGLVRRLPSLEVLDTLNYRFVLWGFAIFTLGIITGAVMAKISWGTFLSVEPVQVLSIVTWILYATLLHTRSIGWRGRRAAILTLFGFVLLVVSFIGLGLGEHSGPAQ